MLTLAAQPRGTTVATGSTDAVIQDGSFESYTGTAFNGTKSPPVTNCGWTYGRIDGDESDSYALIWNAMRGVNSWNLPRISADGECVMILRHKAFAYTEVVIPQDGTYELSFAVSRRLTAYPYLDVYFGHDADSLALVTRTGTFRLQADVGLWGYSNNNYYDGLDVGGTPCIHTAIQIGDAAPIALGGLSRPFQRMETLTWPTTFTIADTNATVTLTVSNSVHNGAAMLDNFAFLPYRDETELVTDGGFETSGTWRMDAPERDTSNAIYSYCAAKRMPYTSDPQYYGYARYEGDCRFLMTDRGFATQEITFPAAGRYSLRFHVSERADSRYTPENKGLCPYRAWIARDGVTNVIGRSTASTSNYVAHTWRFTVPDVSAPWTFGFESVNEVSSSNKDRTVLIDGVSIVRDETDEDETPNLPEKLDIAVAADAQLRLEFTGTNRINRLTLGGVPVSGIVSAQTHPAYITGDGAFEILPKGTMLLFR